MPSRKVEQAALPIEQTGGVCEVCGETVGEVVGRHNGVGMKVGFCCIGKTSVELAVAYGRRLRRIAER